MLHLIPHNVIITPFIHIHILILILIPHPKTLISPQTQYASHWKNEEPLPFRHRKSLVRSSIINLRNNRSITFHNNNFPNLRQHLVLFSHPNQSPNHKPKPKPNTDPASCSPSLRNLPCCPTTILLRNHRYLRRHQILKPTLQLPRIRSRSRFTHVGRVQPTGKNTLSRRRS